MFNSSLNNSLTRANKKEIIEWSMPDWDSGVALPVDGTETTITDCGWIGASGQSYAATPFNIKINGVEHYVSYFSALGTTSNTLYFPVSPNDKVLVVSGTTPLYLTFYPCKGA